MSSHPLAGMTFGTLERVGLEAKMGRNPPSHFTWGVGYAGASGDTLSFGQQSQTPLPIPAFLSMVASVPTTHSTGCGMGLGPAVCFLDDVPVCCGTMDSKQSVDVSGRREVGCTLHPYLHGGTFGQFYICCYMRWAQHLCV